MEKIFVVDDKTVNELLDPAVEIRIGALREVTSVLHNNILFKDVNEAAEELSAVSLETLILNLIGWFQFRPVIQEAEVLDLLILILGRKDFLRHVAKYISVSNLQKEFMKICKVILVGESLIKLQTIQQLLHGYNQEIAVSGSGSATAASPPNVSVLSTASDRSSTKRSPVPVPPTSVEVASSDEFYEKLDGLNLDTFNGLVAELRLNSETNNLSNVLNFLQVSADDYPPEFFLQPPDVLESLVDLLDKVENDSLAQAVKFIRYIINGIRARCKKQKKGDFVPVKKQTNEILRAITKYFKKFHENLVVQLKLHQNVLHEVFLLLIDLAAFIGETQNFCGILANKLMNMMAVVARDLRMAYATAREDSGMTRVVYVLCIHILNVLAASIDTDKIRAQYKNNAWEFESNFLLLDGPLMIAYPETYNLVRDNRASVIDDDEDLMVLLNIRQHLKPVVQLFQSWMNMTDDEIILKGVEAIDTIRIHRSVELVELLMKSITKCSGKFTENSELQEAAEEIYLRLLSIEVPEIRKCVYSIVIKNLKACNAFVNEDCISDDDDDAFVNEGNLEAADFEVKLVSSSLCSIVGIPLTTEIVAEILCFASDDQDEEMNNSVRLILFAFLCFRTTFANHWLRILDVIKPILPLTTALVSTDSFLGLHAFQVFRPHSGFAEFELNQAYARFLFSSSPMAKEMAKTKLLESLGVDSELIQVVPSDFCIVPEASVRALLMPDSKGGYDEESYNTTCQLLQSVDRTNSDLMQSVLVQLAVMMNSREVVQKSYDDNIWAYLMLSLDMGFPNNAIIRKQSINILYNWVVCIPTFRIYLAKEPTVLEFLIKTLIDFQGQKEIKEQASWLLFLLLFSDFIVTTENIISLPHCLSVTCCPFKFERHWTESPFNKITATERIMSCDGPPNIREVARSFMRFTFAQEWFRNENIVEIENFSGKSYRRERNKRTFRVCRMLRLNDQDIACLRQTTSEVILMDICRQLETVTVVQAAGDLIQQTKNLLMIPAHNPAEFAEAVYSQIEKFSIYSSTNKTQQKLFVGCLQIFQQIFHQLKPERIVSAFCTTVIFSIVMGIDDNQITDEAYIEVLNLMSCVVKLCRDRSALTERLMKTFERVLKVHLPSKIVERLSDHLFTDVMRDRKWHDANKRPKVKAILTVLGNVLHILPVHLDDAFLASLFHKLLSITTSLYRSHPDHLKASSTLHIYSSLLKDIFAILLSISSAVGRLELTADHYRSFDFWTSDQNRKHTAMPWMIMAQLTKKKESFDKFCKGFKDAMGLKIFYFAFATLIRPRTELDETAIVVMIGNSLDHDSQAISNEPLCLAKIVKVLLVSGNISALSFFVMKLVQNDIPRSDALVIHHDLISSFLKLPVELNKCEEEAYRRIVAQLEAVVVCYKYEPLKDHVASKLMSEASANFMWLMVGFDTSEPHPVVFKKFNHIAFDLLLILMQSEEGLMKLCRTLSQSRIIEKLMLASHDSLRITNPHNELMFQLSFWHSLIYSCEKFRAPAMNLISMNSLRNGAFNSSVPFGKVGTILERKVKQVRYAVDLLFLQVVSIFDFAFASKFDAEQKHDLKVLSFLIIAKLTSGNERIRQLVPQINLLSIITIKLKLSLTVMQSNRYLETMKQNGVQKCQFMIKDLCILLKALVSWGLPLSSKASHIKELFKMLLKVSDWIDADTTLTNCFLHFLQVISRMEIGRSCVMEEIAGSSVVETILKKTQALSAKPLHTGTNLAMIRNGISALVSCSKFVEVRMMLKNAKLFQMLVDLHPQLEKNRKSTWDDVTVEWLNFFEFLSRFDDTECSLNHISLLCRLNRQGNSKIKRIALFNIKNFSLKASIGHVLLSSDDFQQTVNEVLRSGDAAEKMLILQTLLIIASKSDQLNSKMKNSSLNRKLKDQLAIMQSDAQFKANPENEQIMNLTTMLNQVLYDKE